LLTKNLSALAPSYPIRISLASHSAYFFQLFDVFQITDLNLPIDREAAVLVREGKPVATLSPLPIPAIACSELAERWPSLAKLSPEEACDFADDIEKARTTLPPLRPAWD
jgi:hypothetical protein